MKYVRMKRAEARKGDDPCVIDAIQALLNADVDVRRPPDKGFHLKVTPSLSYYPHTGRIVFDGEPALEERGVEALLKLLDGMKLDGALARFRQT
jgi:hypothetical protein